MKLGKKLTILLILIIILCVLILICYQKYTPTKEVNTYKKEKSTEVKDDIEQTNNNIENEKELITSLYNKIRINDANTECMDYYLNDKITLDNISNELVSYLILKNLNVTPSETTTQVSLDNLKSISKDLFNKEELLPTYNANVKTSSYMLEYFVEFNTYALTRSEAPQSSNNLEIETVSGNVSDEEIKISEKFKLSNETLNTSGTITYTFKNIDNNYYLYSIERTLN